MQLMHMKLRSGVDIITYVLSETQTYVTLKDPVEFKLDPNQGIYGVEWLFLSEESVGTIYKGDILLMNKCSTKGMQYYNEFVNRHLTPIETETSSITSDLETMFTAMMESKTSTKH